MSDICKLLSSPFYIIRGWLLFYLFEPGTIIYNKYNYKKFHIVDNRFIANGEMLCRISYKDMGKTMNVVKHIIL